MVQAKRHDSITTIFALQEIRELLPDITIKDAIFDGAMDNYATSELCRHWGIRPFIPLDSKTVVALNNLPRGIEGFDDKGQPICPGGIPYTYWGPRGNKGLKFRCYFAAHNQESPCCCTPSSYGRTVYIKPNDDLRLFPAVARHSETYKEKLKQRSGAERTNNESLLIMTLKGVICEVQSIDSFVLYWLESTYIWMLGLSKKALS